MSRFYGGGSDGYQNPKVRGYGKIHYGDGILTVGIKPHGNDGNPRTSSETRPKNITLNLFIKINDH